jgi:hypothetical protein
MGTRKQTLHPLNKRNTALIEDDRWKKKGHYHPRSFSRPKLCPICNGSGYVMGDICQTCDGEGIVH